MSAPKFAPVRQAHLYDTVYERLAEALADGILRPDERLRIRDLAAQLGTSVTPVRDALLRLVEGGAVEMRGPRDIRVPRMTRAQFEEILEIRLALEGLAAARAGVRAGHDDVAALGALLEAIEDARRLADPLPAIRLNRRFHAEIARASASPVLEEMIARMWLRMGPVIGVIYADGGAAMVAHYHPLIAALAAGDGARAREAICADIDAAAQIIRASGVLA